MSKYTQLLLVFIIFLTGTANAQPLITFNTKTDFTTGSDPYSVSIGDLNGDGKPDLAVANYVPDNVSVFLNTTAPGAATPSFSTKVDFTTGTYPYSVSIGDLNGDGKPDLAVANYYSDNVSVLLNTTAPGASTPGFSTKVDFSAGSGPQSVSIGDLNGDGKPDLAVANYSSNTVSVFLNTTTPGASSPTFSTKSDFTTGSGPYSVSIGDLNGDGKPDLAVANYYSDNVSVFLNTTAPGASTPGFSTKVDFSTGSGTGPVFVSIGDLNGDGKPDLAVANYNSNNVSVFLNTTTPGASTPGFSTKVDFTTGTNPISASIGDLNGDGKPDLAVANYNSNNVSVLLNGFTPLPVELTSFSAFVKNNAVVLNWETATEVNNYGFEVQRKIINSKLKIKNWMKIGFDAGHGNSNTPNEYSYTDKEPLGGSSFDYRLKQIDVDGNYKYSDIITIDLLLSSKPELMQNSPNPFNPSTSIKYFIPKQADVIIKIYDMLGREVTTLINNKEGAGYHITFWNGRDKYGQSVSSGVYLYRLTAVNTISSFSKTKKMTLLK